MSKIDTTVGRLVAMVTDRDLRLPALQRRYVWSAPQVRDLLDSLYRMYPSGTILVWETDREMPSRDLDVEGTVNVNPFIGGKLLLDGQQRLTSLSAVLHGKPVKVRRGRRLRLIEILFNLDHPEGPPVEVLEVNEAPEDPDDTDSDTDESEDSTLQEKLKLRTFVVSSRSLAADRHWVNVSDIFVKNDAELLRGLVTSLDDPLFDKYSKRLQAVRKIRDYPYVMHVLDKNLSYEEVAVIFVRVNSLGTKLRGSDLAMAQITSRWQESLELFEAFQEECEDQSFTFDLGLIVRALVVFTTDQSRFKIVARTPVSKFTERWPDAKAGLTFALNYLRANAGIEDESLLSSPLFLITIGYLARHRNSRLSVDEDSTLRRWLYIANARGHYSATTESTLDNDLNIIRRGEGAAKLLEHLSQRFGRLTIEPSDLIGRGQKSPLLSTAYLALKAQGAKDWETRFALSLTLKGRDHSIEHHHIFPKNVLKNVLKKRYDPSEVNEIANMAFIAGGTNRRLGKTPPEEYLPRVLQEQGEVALKAHCVPLDSNLWRIDNFREFLEYRRAALAAAINHFINLDTAPVAVVEIGDLVAAGESDIVEFKASARWDYRESRANKALEGVVVKTVAGFVNSKGGTLLIGVEDSGNVVGLQQDYSTLNQRPDRDGYQQFLVNLISSNLGASVHAHLAVSLHDVRGQDVCAIRCSPSPVPVYVTEGGVSRLFARTGNTTQELPGRQAVEYVRSHWSGAPSI